MLPSQTQGIDEKKFRKVQVRRLFPELHTEEAEKYDAAVIYRFTEGEQGRHEISSE